MRRFTLSDLPSGLTWPLVLVALVTAVGVMLPTDRRAAEEEISLPTSNDGIYHDEDSLFYMETANSRRDPWNGGKFGFVRNPRRTRNGQVFVRHHAGVDIRPLYRDRRGEPLDSVLSIADGIVAYVNDTAGHSNYGRYILIEHRWQGSPYYSLYAHVSGIWVDSGATVRRGQPIARIGYTGAGINRRRAHLHLELALLVNQHFQCWYDRSYRRQPNRHGIFNGINLVSVDVARFFLKLRENPTLTIPELVAEEQPFYTVTIPRNLSIDMLSRYPWLLRRAAEEDDRSWIITFARHGLPLGVEPSDEKVDSPRVRILESSAHPYLWLTKSMLAGSGEKATLSGQGVRWIELLTARPDSAFNVVRGGRVERTTGAR